MIAAPDDADLAVYEMGAGKPGDIAYLTDIARPDVALVNNIAPAHLERMGSLLGVAQTKGAIYTALPADGVAVINADDAFGAWFEQQLLAQPLQGRRVLRYGLHANAEISARQLRLHAAGAQFVLVTPQGETPAVLPPAATTCSMHWLPPAWRWAPALRCRSLRPVWPRPRRWPGARLHTRWRPVRC